MLGRIFHGSCRHQAGATSKSVRFGLLRLAGKRSTGADWLASGGAQILVDKPWSRCRGTITPPSVIGWGTGGRRPSARCGRGPVVVVEVLAKDLDLVALVHDDQPIQTLSPQRARYPLAGGVRAGRFGTGFGQFGSRARRRPLRSRSQTSSRRRGSRLATSTASVALHVGLAALRSCYHDVHKCGPSCALPPQLDIRRS